MKMDDGPGFGAAFFRAHQIVIDRKKVFGGQLVRPFDVNRVAAADLDGRSGHTVRRSPRSAWAVHRGGFSRRTRESEFVIGNCRPCVLPVWPRRERAGDRQTMRDVRGHPGGTGCRGGMCAICDRPLVRRRRSAKTRRRSQDLRRFMYLQVKSLGYGYEPVIVERESAGWCSAGSTGEVKHVVNRIGMWSPPNRRRSTRDSSSAR